MFNLNLSISRSLLPLTQSHQTYVLPGPIAGIYSNTGYYQLFAFRNHGFASQPLGSPFFNGYSSYGGLSYYNPPGNISDYMNFQTSSLLRNIFNPNLYGNSRGNIMDTMNGQVDHYLMKNGIAPLLGTSSPQGSFYNPYSYGFSSGNIMDNINFQVDRYLMSQGVPPLLGTAHTHPEVFNMGTNSAAFNILRNPMNMCQPICYPTFCVSA